jgi:hypothetical protein
MSRRKVKPATLNDETRRLQKAQALLIAIQHAARQDIDFDAADALSVIVALVEETLAGLDRVEVRTPAR